MSFFDSITVKEKINIGNVSLTPSLAFKMVHGNIGGPGPTGPQGNNSIFTFRKQLGNPVINGNSVTFHKKNEVISSIESFFPLENEVSISFTIDTFQIPDDTYSFQFGLGSSFLTFYQVYDTSNILHKKVSIGQYYQSFTESDNFLIKVRFDYIFFYYNGTPINKLINSDPPDTAVKLYGFLSTSSDQIVNIKISNIIISTSAFGPQGFTGPTGNDGMSFTGDTGPQGIHGNDGMSFTGEKGDTGDTGPQGIPGNDGMSFTGEKGDTGPQGIPGNDGMSYTGEKGDTGPQGIPGNDGMSYTGEKGETGPQGIHGNDGISYTGEKGDTGDTGPQGIPGNDGICFTGSTGPTGASGRDGMSFTGTTGPTGTSGRDGISFTGEKGDTGPQGIPGNDGMSFTGEKGDTGPQGAPGNDGRNGFSFTGPPGNDGISFTGDTGPSGKDGVNGPNTLLYTYNSNLKTRNTFNFTSDGRGNTFLGISAYDYYNMDKTIWLQLINQNSIISFFDFTTNQLVNSYVINSSSYNVDVDSNYYATFNCTSLTSVLITQFQDGNKYYINYVLGGLTGATGANGIDGLSITGPTGSSGKDGRDGISYTGPSGRDGLSITGPTGPAGSSNTSSNSLFSNIRFENSNANISNLFTFSSSPTSTGTSYNNSTQFPYNHAYVEFSGAANFTMTPNADVTNVIIFAVGGGGGGSCDGGGGAGGLQTNDPNFQNSSSSLKQSQYVNLGTFTLQKNITYNVIVGGGGQGAIFTEPGGSIADPPPYRQGTISTPTNGLDTVLSLNNQDIVRAKGGGCGGGSVAYFANRITWTSTYQLLGNLSATGGCGGGEGGVYNNSIDLTATTIIASGSNGNQGGNGGGFTYVNTFASVNSFGPTSRFLSYNPNSLFIGGGGGGLGGNGSSAYFDGSILNFSGGNGGSTLFYEGTNKYYGAGGGGGGYSSEGSGITYNNIRYSSGGSISDTAKNGLIGTGGGGGGAFFIANGGNSGYYNLFIFETTSNYNNSAYYSNKSTFNGGNGGDGSFIILVPVDQIITTSFDTTNQVMFGITGTTFSENFNGYSRMQISSTGPTIFGSGNGNYNFTSANSSNTIVSINNAGTLQVPNINCTSLITCTSLNATDMTFNNFFYYPFSTNYGAQLVFDFNNTYPNTAKQNGTYMLVTKAQNGNENWFSITFVGYNKNQDAESPGSYITGSSTVPNCTAKLLPATPNGVTLSYVGNNQLTANVDTPSVANVQTMILYVGYSDIGSGFTYAYRIANTWNYY